MKFASNMVGAHLEEHILLTKEKSLLPWSVKAARYSRKQADQGDGKCGVLAQKSPF